MNFQQAIAALASGKIVARPGKRGIRRHIPYVRNPDTTDMRKYNIIDPAYLESPKDHIDDIELAGMDCEQYSPTIEDVFAKDWGVVE